MNVLLMLEQTGAVAEGHFVYKKRNMHGMGYIDKDQFALIGATNLVETLEAEGESALDNGLDQLLGQEKKVGLILPAFGAIKLGLPLAAYLEKRTGIRIIVVETEVERDAKGKRYHLIPENQKKMIYGMPIMAAEDIVNNGETLKEIKALIINELNSKLFAALCVVDRGGQTVETLGIEGYYPYMRINMNQHDCKLAPCPQCLAGVPINTDLGKGSEWVSMFGQPPYPPGMDFSAIWKDEQ